MGLVHAHVSVQGADTRAHEYFVPGGAVGDFDRDGDQDVFVIGGSGAVDRLYWNNGSGVFVEGAAAAGLARTHRGSGAAVGDVDNDGDLDLYVTSIGVAFINAPHQNRLYLNDGDGTFTDATASAGVGLDSNGMGSAVGDFDNDGLMDWYVTSRINPGMTAGSGNMLYRATGAAHVFEEVSVDRGVNFGWWGWGTAGVDFDQDGDLDLIATNGFDGTFANDPTLLFVNDGAGHFTEMAAASGISDTGQGRGLLRVDLENDGDQDVLIFRNRQTVVCLLNDSVSGGGGGRRDHAAVRYVGGRGARARRVRDAGFVDDRRSDAGVSDDGGVELPGAVGAERAHRDRGGALGGSGDHVRGRVGGDAGGGGSGAVRDRGAVVRGGFQRGRGAGFL